MDSENIWEVPEFWKVARIHSWDLAVPGEEATVYAFLEGQIIEKQSGEISIRLHGSWVESVYL